MRCGDIDLNCTKCRLSKSRTKVVPGVGPCPCPVVFVGEAPGRDEDVRGEPFVGMAGRVLVSALEEAGVSRTDVRITNLVKCRPPDNRRPRKDEKMVCASLYLDSEMRALRPKVVCALGQTVAEHLLGRKLIMSDVVGRTYPAVVAGREVKVLVAYHPAACLYRRKNLGTFKQSISKSIVESGLR